ncbi:MAG: hypothetical protein Q8N99_06785 [Nanoarchaeota archaeon]|nr:hypothetical protein [Nanoarchaeota archaeon]
MDEQLKRKNVLDLQFQKYLTIASTSIIKKTMGHHTLKVFCHGKKSPAGECGLIGPCF